MCHFKSAIVFRNCDILCYDETDSHEDIIAAHGLMDNGRPIASRSWVRVEFSPPENLDGIQNPAKWSLKVDETSAPDWWAEIQDRVRDEMWARIKRSLITDERKCLIGGAWIILPGAKVRKLVRGRIISAKGANLEDANLWGANLEGANLEGANLERANLRGANLWCANLRGANLERANLEGANLQGANLECANLQDANLQGANLEDANLECANLECANLQDANLRGAYRLDSDPAIGGWGVKFGKLIRSK